MSLDPRTNREDREAERAAEAAAQIPPLNPPFPYRRASFAPFFFGVTVDTRELQSADD